MQKRQTRFGHNAKTMNKIVQRISEYTLEEIENKVLAHKVKIAQKKDRVQKARDEKEAKKLQREIEKDCEEKLREIIENPEDQKTPKK